MSVLKKGDETEGTDGHCDLVIGKQLYSSSRIAIRAQEAASVSEGTFLFIPMILFSDDAASHQSISWKEKGDIIKGEECLPCVINPLTSVIAEGNWLE